MSTLISKDRVIPGCVVVVVHGGKRGLTDGFVLNAHQLLSDSSTQSVLAVGTFLFVDSKPRKLDGDGSRMVDVRTNDGRTGKVYYTDLVNRCRGVDS